MKALRILLVGLAALAVVLGAAFGIAWLLTAPVGLPEGSESAARLAPGPHSVGHVELVWVDGSRPTAENGAHPRSSERTFRVAVWYPEGVDRRHPLAVYSHGFMSSRHGGTYLAEHLASYGYVVASADYPLTHAQAPGGPNFLDVVHQPADVSFLIDEVTALAGVDKPFEGEIDIERIGAFGLSLGGITTTVVTFDPRLRDPRVRAAISIAGAGDVFGPGYFDHAAVPFLMIAGTSDAIVDYELNALPIPDRIREGGLVSIVGGTHVGFAHVAAGAMRVLGNPDSVACRAAAASTGDADSASAENAFVGLFGTAEQGLLEPAEYRPGCSRMFEQAIAAGRQQMLTTLAVRAFFESHFAGDPKSRADHEAFLTRTMSSELPDVSYTPSRR
jgi:predicted dienelactone hydrolase